MPCVIVLHLEWNCSIPCCFVCTNYLWIISIWEIKRFVTCNVCYSL